MFLECSDSVLIIGVDGYIGSALFQKLKGSQKEVFGTSRRVKKINDNRIFFLDLAEPLNDLSSLPNAKLVYLVAGISNMSQCEKDKITYDINVNKIVEIGEYFLRQGSFIIFLSTNTVFNGKESFPNEFCTPNPINMYGYQKLQAEKKLREASLKYKNFNLAIVRLTKVLSLGLPLLDSWIKDLSNGKVIKSFHDLVISPISLSYVISCLITIGDRRVSGVYHLSGVDDISYNQVAKKIALKLKFDPTKVKEESALERGYRLPSYSSLGLLSTKEVLNISPQKIDELLEDIYNENNN